ncbi:MAG: VCBS repeat-containing protein [bacterium]|nr:VCBS repeat-containing protein [bacterium]
MKGLNSRSGRSSITKRSRLLWLWGGFPPAPILGAMVCLYRNEGKSRFTEVTAEAGFNQSTYGQGAAWGDYDNVGDLDFFLADYGPNRLYCNNGDGIFCDAGSVEKHQINQLDRLIEFGHRAGYEIIAKIVSTQKSTLFEHQDQVQDGQFEQD